MRVLLLGDTHGNDRFFKLACHTAIEQGCDTVFQLGDFGYWEHYPQGVQYLEYCSAVLSVLNLRCIFLDGNHENHPLLWAKYGPAAREHTVSPEGFWRVRERLHYAPRGHRWSWEGIRFLALGGAYSIDEKMRTPGKSWWATELITDREVEVASAGGKVDVMLSHDAPWGVSIPSLERAIERHGAEVYPLSRQNREQVSRVVDVVQPHWLIHGHYHDRYTDHYQSTGIVGLGADFNPLEEAVLVLDTDKILG
jgi:calcineurin-like phosphoesterase family protein